MYVLWRVLVKELLQLRHDRRMIPVMIVGPLMQLFALGFAANTDVQHLPMLLVDLDRTEDSRRLVDDFLGSGYFDLAGVEPTESAIEPWLIAGRAEVALVIERGYGADLAAERTAQVQIIADGTNSNSAVVGLGYAARIVAATSLAQPVLDPRGATPLSAARGTAAPEVLAGSCQPGSVPASDGCAVAEPDTIRGRRPRGAAV